MRLLRLAAVMAALSLAAAVPAHAGDEGGEGEAPPDSLDQGAGSSTLRPPGERPFQGRDVMLASDASLFHPNYKLTFKREQDVSAWDHAFVLNYPLSQRLNFHAGALINLRETDVLNRTNLQENWSAGLDVAVSSAVNMGIALNRIKQVDIRDEGQATEVRSFREKETIDLSTGYKKEFLTGLEATVGGSAGLEKNIYADVRSDGSAQTINASLAYVPAANVKGNVSYSGNHSLLDSEQGTLQSTDESFTHNLGAAVDYTWGANTLNANIGRNTSTKEYPKEEQTERRDQDGESANLKGTFNLLPGLEMIIGYDHNRTKSFYEIESTRDSDLATRAVDASLKYTIGETRLSGDMHSETKRNEYFNEQTGDSYGQSIGVSVAQPFGDRVSATLKGLMTLYSHHYDDIEANDQDRDLFDREATLVVDYKPVADITTGLTLRVREDQLIYIRRTRTADNKTTQTYALQPFIRKVFSSKLSASQRYEISADYTFYKYDNDKNFLIRNFGVTTGVDWAVIDPLRITVSHTYRGQDEGSYVEGPDGVERYGKNSERDDQSMKITLSYRFLDVIDLEATQEFSVQEKWRIEDGERIPSWDKFDTSITGKASADYKLADGTTLSFSVGLTEREGTSVVERQREVWNISVNIDKTF